MTIPIESRLMAIAGSMVRNNINDVERPSKNEIRTHHKQVIEWAKEIAEIAREVRADKLPRKVHSEWRGGVLYLTPEDEVETQKSQTRCSHCKMVADLYECDLAAGRYCDKCIDWFGAKRKASDEASETRGTE